nr:TonB-dependent receptor plug domain-containing protein [uncultured Brevundimonas sp.]
MSGNQGLLLAGVGLAALLTAGSASAQSQSEATALEEIIVTGEKTDRALQDTPTSVGVTTARRIEREAIQTLGEVFERTANLTETYGHAGFTIRGIGNQGVSGGGDAALATIYVDGAPMPPTLTFSGPTDAWDVRQIEIFRGPQSTLQGLNALAGSVVIRTVEPGFDWDLRARAIIADPKETAFAVAGGGPLIKDELAFRVSAEKRDGDGFVHNETRDAPEDPIDKLTVRARLLWTPKTLPGFEARLGYTHYESDGGYPVRLRQHRRAELLQEPPGLFEHAGQQPYRDGRDDAGADPGLVVLPDPVQRHIVERRQTVPAVRQRRHGRQSGLWLQRL